MAHKEKIVREKLEWEINNTKMDFSFLDTITDTPICCINLGVSIIKNILGNEILIDYKDVQIIFDGIIAFKMNSNTISKYDDDPSFNYYSYDITEFIDILDLNSHEYSNKWLIEKISPNPFFYRVLNSKWVQQYAESTMHHYLLTTNDFYIELLVTKNYNWFYVP